MSTPDSFLIHKVQNEDDLLNKIVSFGDQLKEIENKVLCENMTSDPSISDEDMGDIPLIPTNEELHTITSLDFIPEEIVQNPVSLITPTQEHLTLPAILQTEEEEPQRLINIQDYHKSIVKQIDLLSEKSIKLLTDVSS